MEWVGFAILVIVLLVCAFGLYAVVSDPESYKAARAVRLEKQHARKIATTDTSERRKSQLAQEVVEYKSREAFQQDSSKWIQQGWRVVSVSDAPQRAGAARIATLGIGAVVAKPASHVFVVYERSSL
jgi:hypothetical protein